jgi:MFS superfamily sulfate permease-like transporter
MRTERQGQDPNRSTGKTFGHDCSASLVVFLVALPLCMGVAQASGVRPEAGIITGVVGGLIVGLLAGSPLQVSGPAAGLFVLVAGIVGNPQLGLPMLGVVVLGAGLIQVVMGCLRLGQWFRAVSPAVVGGMLAGIGVLLFASQFHIMLDDQVREKGKGIPNLLSIPEGVLKAIDSGNAGLWHQEAALIGVLTILLLVFWKLLAPKRVQIVPAPVVAILVAAVVAAALGWGIKRVDISANLLEGVRASWPTGDTLGRAFEGPVLAAMFTIALIASAETLLCATAVDQMHTGPRTRYDRELMAQGIGNVLCGLLGALPMTGVIARSTANLQAGARTRLSAILHGFWLLLMVVAAPSLLRLIPTAALAAVLVYIGFKLVSYKAMKELWQTDRGELAIYFATMATIVAKDLLTGVLLGIVLSVVKLVWKFSRLRVRLEDDPQARRTILHLEGSATFIRLPYLASVLEAVPGGSELHVHFENLAYIDHACLELLINWEKQHEATGGSLVIDWDTLTARFHTPVLRPPGNGENGNGRSGFHVRRSSRTTAARV